MPFLFVVFASTSASLFVFQGSEWNAANFEELQKNKSVFSPAACFHTSVVLLSLSSCHGLVQLTTLKCVLCLAESPVWL